LDCCFVSLFDRGVGVNVLNIAFLSSYVCHLISVVLMIMVWCGPILFLRRVISVCVAGCAGVRWIHVARFFVVKIRDICVH
jgi:hypothetical protein